MVTLLFFPGSSSSSLINRRIHCGIVCSSLPGTVYIPPIRQISADEDVLCCCRSISAIHEDSEDQTIPTLRCRCYRNRFPPVSPVT